MNIVKIAQMKSHNIDIFFTFRKTRNFIEIFHCLGKHKLHVETFQITAFLFFYASILGKKLFHRIYHIFVVIYTLLNRDIIVFK